MWDYEHFNEGVKAERARILALKTTEDRMASSLLGPPVHVHQLEHIRKEIEKGRAEFKDARY